MRERSHYRLNHRDRAEAIPYQQPIQIIFDSFIIIMINYDFVKQPSKETLPTQSTVHQLGISLP